MIACSGNVAIDWQSTSIVTMCKDRANKNGRRSSRGDCRLFAVDLFYDESRSTGFVIVQIVQRRGTGQLPNR